MSAFLARQAALEAQLDAAFDEAIARVLAMVADCPVRGHRSGDAA